MKFILTLTLLFSQVAMADVINDRIHSVEENVIKFENGRVAIMDASFEIPEDGSLVEAEVSGRSKLLSLKLIDSADSSPFDGTLKVLEPTITPADPVAGFEPTVLPSLDEAKKMFNRLNPFSKLISECSDRAHVWSYDEFKNNAIKTKKVFIFFTASYINRVGMKWWFHVAPLASVKEGETVTERVMDYRYSTGPKLIKEWSDFMVFSKRPCKVTTKFSEYDVNPQTEDCYMIFSSMYYRLPADLSAAETTGRVRAAWSEPEVNGARNRAFTTIK